MIVLASASPRRQELLKLLVSTFEIAPADIDETLPETITSEYAAEYLAVQKALAASLTRPEDAVIGCDTVVILENEILGKPADTAQARSMLKKLSGKTHSVYTGVCLSHRGTTISFTEKTAVTFYELPDNVIDAYIETGSPMDKAGAYGIQDDMIRCYTRGLDGSFENVMGLPVAAIRERLMLDPTFKPYMI